MTFQRLEAFTKKVSDLADKPSLNASELKAQFDAAPEELRQSFNTLVDALNSLPSQQEAWKDMTLSSGWVPQYNGSSFPCYKKDLMGFVHLKGTIRSGGIGPGNIITTLPVGYRPSEILHISCSSHDGTNYVVGRYSIDPSGNLWMDFGGSGAAYFDSISFFAEQ